MDLMSISQVHHDQVSDNVPSSLSGKLARCDEYDKSFLRKVTKSEGSPLTTMIPSEFGPNASSSFSNLTEPSSDECATWTVSDKLYLLVVPVGSQLLVRQPAPQPHST